MRPFIRSVSYSTSRYRPYTSMTLFVIFSTMYYVLTASVSKCYLGMICVVSESFSKVDLCKSMSLQLLEIKIITNLYFLLSTCSNISLNDKGIFRLKRVNEWI